MIYCKKCGKQITEDSEFCPHCGASQREQAVNRVSGGKAQLHCPRCKGHVLSPVVETVSNEGVAYRLGGRTAVAGGKNLNRTSWICQECGCKFRNLEDLEKEKRGYEIGTKLMLVTVGLFLLLFLLLGKEMFLFLLLVLGPCAIACVFGLVYCWVMSKKMGKEAEYLRENCFD